MRYLGVYYPPRRCVMRLHPLLQNACAGRVSGAIYLGHRGRCPEDGPVHTWSVRTHMPALTAPSFPSSTLAALHLNLVCAIVKTILC